MNRPRATPLHRLAAALIRRGERHAHLLRYALAIVGPMGVAGTQFLVSLAMIHLLPPSQFGGFSFLMVANVLNWGICSALYTAPLPLLLYQQVEGVRRDGETMLVSASALHALATSIGFAAVAWLLGLSGIEIALFTGYAWASFSRYFARSHALARHDQWKATFSDLAFSLSLACGIAIAVLAGGRGSGGTLVYAALAASALLGLLPFGLPYLHRLLPHLRIADVRGYSVIWKRMSSWSVLGVVTTEATNNAHAYLVTAFLGPAAFAPLAASALVTRPVSVISTALSDFERPRLARQIGEARFSEMRHSLRMFHGAIAAAWLLTALIVAAVFLFVPQYIFPPHYSLRYLAIGAALWMLVAGARLAAIPPSCTLIAQGSFRLLAMTSLWSGVLATAAVAGFLLLGETLLSIVGVLIGQTVYALMIRRHAAAWLARQRDGVPPGKTTGN